MKKCRLHLYILSLLFAIGLFSSCEPIPVLFYTPAITFVETADYLYTDTIFEAGKNFKVKIMAAKGSDKLKLMGINENGNRIALDRIVSGMESNPVTLSDADTESFEMEIEILAQEDGISKYTFYVEDEGGFTNGVDFSINEVFIPLDGEFTKLQIFNSNGSFFSSLDAHEPKAVGNNDEAGDVMDSGIDPGLPLSDNWLRKIAPKNGASLLLPAADLNYDELDNKKEMLDAANVSTTILRSKSLEPNDLLIIKTDAKLGQGNDYFLLKVDSVINTIDDNNDYYIFSLKRGFGI